MATARDIMTSGTECIGAEETVLEAAQKMAQLGVGALPICGTDDKLKGVVTDRDIVVKVLAEGTDPGATKAGDLAQGEVIFVRAADDAEEVLATMSRRRVRRVPVIEEHRLVGMIALADVARALPSAKAGDVLEAVSSD